MGWIFRNPIDWGFRLAVACFRFETTRILNLGIYLMVFDFTFRAVFQPWLYIISTTWGAFKYYSNVLGPKNTGAQTKQISGDGPRTCFISSAQDSNEQPELNCWYKPPALLDF